LPLSLLLLLLLLLLPPPTVQHTKSMFAAAAATTTPCPTHSLVFAHVHEEVILALYITCGPRTQAHKQRK
jgi:hypothetical protein